MRILFDTNIIIEREDDRVLSNSVIDLSKILNELNCSILVHPYSIRDIAKDKNSARKKKILSKLNTYQQLENPPNPKSDKNFITVVGDSAEGTNDWIDNSILYAVYKNAVDFLVTEDKIIRKKAQNLGIYDRVLSIEGSISTFSILNFKTPSKRIPLIKNIPCHSLEINDRIFDTLRGDYPEFNEWFARIQKKGRKSYVYFRNDGSLGALMIYKDEDEPIDSFEKNYPKQKRIKISTLIVTYVGYKIGELFINLSVNLALENDIDEIYLTHYVKEDDLLVDLITQYGFFDIGKNSRGESVYVKKLMVDRKILEKESPVSFAKKYYPVVYDGDQVNKFIIPIKPEYHEILFTDYKSRQTKITEHMGEFIIPGNTIKKAYLCHSQIKRLKKGDLLLFYRSQDSREITSLGVVEEIHLEQTNLNDIIRHVGKRTVYSRIKIEEIVRKPTLVILFIHSFHFKKMIKFKDLKELGILKGAPQSITHISHESYLKLKNKGFINANLTIN